VFFVQRKAKKRCKEGGLLLFSALDIFENRRTGQVFKRARPLFGQMNREGSRAQHKEMMQKTAFALHQTTPSYYFSIICDYLRL
jgi:hypothetical protein